MVEQRSTRWPGAASMTTSGAGFPVIRRTNAGSCPTSKRCSTTTRCCSGSTRVRAPLAAPRLRAGRFGDRRLPRCATCGRTWVPSTAHRRRQRRGRRKVLRLVRGGIARDSRRSGGGVLPHVRRDPWRKLGRREHPPSSRGLPVGRRRAGRAARESPRDPARRARERGSGPGSTTRSSPAGTDS